MNPQDHPHALSWEAMEFVYVPKTKDWYWIVWIIFLSVGAIAFFSNNYTFAILIVLSAFVLSLLAAKRPLKLSIVIDDNHIHVGNKRYKTNQYESYNVIEAENKLVLRDKKKFVPVLVIPINETTPLGKVRGYLQERKLTLDEALNVSPLELIAERLGF